MSVKWDITSFLKVKIIIYKSKFLSFVLQKVTRKTLKTGTSTSRMSQLSRSSSVEGMLSRTKTPHVWPRRTLAKK
jgi:hypothetical protein